MVIPFITGGFGNVFNFVHFLFSNFFFVLEKTSREFTNNSSTKNAEIVLTQLERRADTVALKGRF